MGSTCGCEFTEAGNEIFHFEFEKAPKEATLIGLAMNEELWVRQNLGLHDFHLQVKSRNKSLSSQKSRNLESFQISLNRSIQSYSKTEDEAGSVLFEGELLKYRPGMSSEYIPRWCRVTYEGFAYYKTQWSATCSNKTPLAFIPLMQIKQVALISRAGKKLQKLSEFEIFIFNEEELIELSRKTEGFTIRKHESQEKVPDSWWSVRQVEWYTAERRLLFASSTKAGAQKWVEVIQDALKFMKQVSED